MTELPPDLPPDLPLDLPRALIAVDYDGTLAPIVDDPDSALPAPGALAALQTLAARGAAVAIITGRDAQNLLDLSGFAAVPGLVVAGLYGAQWWRAGPAGRGQLTSLPPPEAIAAARRLLPTALVGADSLWIEDKQLSLVVHGRRARDPVGALAAVRPEVAALARDLGLCLHDGRDVLEIRLPGYDKAMALQHAIEETGRQQVVYAGDDLADRPAFDLVARRRLADRRPGWTVAVSSEEAPGIAEHADFSVRSPAALVDWLTQLAR